MRSRRVAVIGAGIIGVTTAHELASHGHDVTVFERCGSVAEEASFANAGIVSPGYLGPWAAPGMPAKLFKSIFQKHAPMVFGWPVSMADVSWTRQWLRYCNPTDHASARQAMHVLGRLSQDRMLELVKQIGMDLEVRSGLLILARTDKEWETLQLTAQSLMERGIAANPMDATGARQIEPALNPDTALVGAIHLPNESTANCRQFANLLKSASNGLPVHWRFGTEVKHLTAGPKPMVTSHCGGNTTQEAFDQIVLCTGVASLALLAPLGLSLPLIPIYGYSVSAAVREPINAPFASLMDERYKVAISRLENRVRVAGVGQIGGGVARPNKQSFATLYKVLNDWFPGGAVSSTSVQQWRGARPMLPDGPPVVGPAGPTNIWLNLGHGSSGWALSCGSAVVLREQMENISPSVDVERLQISRFKP
jgi:D-amino-acid dehydrogenase